MCMCLVSTGNNSFVQKIGWAMAIWSLFAHFYSGYDDDFEGLIIIVFFTLIIYWECQSE